MPNLTETYWSVDGESLHTYARTIETIGGMAIPTFRGENITIPHRPGTLYVPKVPNANQITLAMNIRGVAPEQADRGATSVSARSYQSNYSDLVRLLWRDGEQVNLTKRFYDRHSPDIIAATAQVEFKGGLQPTMIGKGASRCTIDLGLSDPFFYANVASSLVINRTQPDQELYVWGNARSYRGIITFTGPLTNPKLRNQTTGTEFTIPVSVKAGEVVTVNLQDYTAISVRSGFPNFDIGSTIINSGAPQWMYIKPGTNRFILTSSSGTGQVKIDFYGAWV